MDLWRSIVAHAFSVPHLAPQFPADQQPCHHWVHVCRSIWTHAPNHLLWARVQSPQIEQIVDDAQLQQLILLLYGKPAGVATLQQVSECLQAHGQPQPSATMLLPPAPAPSVVQPIITPAVPMHTDVPPAQREDRRKQGAHHTRMRGAGRCMGDAQPPRVEPYRMNDCTDVCAACSAHMWPEERPQSKSFRLHATFGLCCDHGRVALPPLSIPPSYFQQLYSNDAAQHPHSAHFLANIRAYNCQLQLASTGVQQVHFASGPHQFRICGRMHHRIGGMQPIEGVTTDAASRAMFAQRYIYDVRLDNWQRWAYEEMRPELAAELQQQLLQCNNYARQCRWLAPTLQQDYVMVFPGVKHFEGSDAWLARHMYNKPSFTNTPIALLLKVCGQECIAWLPSVTHTSSSKEEGATVTQCCSYLLMLAHLLTSVARCLHLTCPGPSV